MTSGQPDSRTDEQARLARYAAEHKRWEHAPETVVLHRALVHEIAGKGATGTLRALYQGSESVELWGAFEQLFQQHKADYDNNLIGECEGNNLAEISWWACKGTPLEAESMQVSGYVPFCEAMNRLAAYELDGGEHWGYPADKHDWWLATEDMEPVNSKAVLASQKAARELDKEDARRQSARSAKEASRE